MKLKFNDPKQHVALAFLTNENFHFAANNKWGYMYATPDGCLGDKEYCWFDSLVEMKNHILNAWLPSSTEIRDENYYNDVQMLIKQLECYPEKKLEFNNLTHHTTQNRIGWVGQVNDMVDYCPSIDEWNMDYLGDDMAA